MGSVGVTQRAAGCSARLYSNHPHQDGAAVSMSPSICAVMLCETSVEEVLPVRLAESAKALRAGQLRRRRCRVLAEERAACSSGSSRSSSPSAGRPVLPRDCAGRRYCRDGVYLVVGDPEFDACAGSIRTADPADRRVQTGGHGGANRCSCRRPTKTGSSPLARTCEPSFCRSGTGRGSVGPHPGPDSSAALRSAGHMVGAGSRLDVLGQHRPAVHPDDLRREGFAAEHVPVRRASPGPDAELDHPPAAVGPRTRSAWPVFWTGRSVPRWVRIGLAGSPRTGPAGTGPGDGHRVAALGAALGDQQVPLVADPVQVRRLRGLGAGARPEPVAARPVPRRWTGRCDWTMPSQPPARAASHQQVPSSSQARSGSMPGRRDAHRVRPGPAGSSA